MGCTARWRAEIIPPFILWFDLRQFPIDSKTFQPYNYIICELTTVLKSLIITACCTAKLEGWWINTMRNYTKDLLQHSIKMFHWSFMYFSHNTSFPNFSDISTIFGSQIIWQTPRTRPYILCCPHVPVPVL